MKWRDALGALWPEDLDGIPGKVKRGCGEATLVPELQAAVGISLSE